MSRRKYSAVVFDLGQVLIPFDYNIFIQAVNRHKDGLGDEFVRKYNQNYYIHRDFERGKISENDFIAQMLEWLEHKVTAEQFVQYWSSIFSLNEDVISLLPKLKEKYKLYLLSNTNSIHQKYGYQHYDFLRIFDKLFLSHEVGFVKPEEGIYKAVESYSKLPPEEHIFIDDIEEYVEAAKKLGWDGVQFTGYDNLVKDLTVRGILS
ncbi:HAD family phosphatase [Ignavibacterium sp.]|jgi:putative hydrolase of the HAD superfamily|uniref:HAD family hydrolase n=1 Tax=Ignavibacterium sp. TaxID=2651167 RepID=UPI0025C52DEF|nr:HAD family phosphatase [Ignavibacterium sp.]